MLKRLQFTPGINKEATRYTAAFGWFDGDKVRFRDGRPESIGGWQKYTSETYRGVARSLFDWAARDGSSYLGIGTNLKFYVEIGEQIIDVTPIRETTAAGDVTFAATTGNSKVVVTDVGNGVVINDFVTFTGATGLGGNITALLLNAEHQVVEVLTNDTYCIEIGVAANASDTANGGASVVGEYQINVGTNFFAGGTGWSLNTWSSGPWGSASPLSTVNQLRLYSQDSFEDDLIFNPRGGGLYYWDESAGTAFRAVEFTDLPGASDVPTKALQVMVSDVDRHVIAFGANPLGSGTIDPLLIRWSDQENAADWTPTAINSSGGQVLPVGSIIIGAAKTRREILVWTDVGITSMRFSGSPFVYSFSTIAENVSLMSPKSMVTAGDSVFFMDREGFYAYRGSIERIKCPVYNYVFDNINLGQRYKVFAGIVQDDAEVTWYYPVGTGNTDITNYVTYNWMEQTWAIGTLDRAAWIHAGTRTYPIASSNNLTDVDSNYIYNHEYGYDADGAPLDSYIESGTVEIGDGDSLMFLRRLIADFQFRGSENSADITVSIKGKRFPLEQIRLLDDATVLAGTTQNHIRARAREISVRIESNGQGYGWTAGDLRVDMRPDGRR